MHHFSRHAPGQKAPEVRFVINGLDRRQTCRIERKLIVFGVRKHWTSQRRVRRQGRIHSVGLRAHRACAETIVPRDFRDRDSQDRSSSLLSTGARRASASGSARSLLRLLNTFST